MITTDTNDSTRPKHAQWGAFGDVSFQTHTAPGQVTDNRQFRWQKQQLVNGYPTHQAGGEDERSMQLEIILHNRFVNISDMYQKLLSMSQNQVPRALVIGSASLGQFAIRSLRTVLTDTSPQGVVISARYSLQLIEVRGENHT